MQMFLRVQSNILEENLCSMVVKSIVCTRTDPGLLIEKESVEGAILSIRERSNSTDARAKMPRSCDARGANKRAESTAWLAINLVNVS